MKIKELKPKDEIQSIFLIKYIAVMESKDGKSYLNIILADDTGDLEARMWQQAEEVFSTFAKGDFAKVNGKINLFQNRMQLIIQDISHADPNEYNPDDYIPKSPNKPDEMYQELISITESINDVYIRDLLMAILTDHDIMLRLKSWPAGKSIHHAYQSGLLEHTLSCTKIGQNLSTFYPVNKNYVIAGCILHDLCKIYELFGGTNVDYTDEGKLIGHVNKGFDLINHFSRKFHNFPRQILMHLSHIMVSHHGEYEFGSSRLPQTCEAMLVHLIDLVDSKMSSLDSVIRNDKNPGNWSAFVKHLDRLIYKTPLPTFTEYIQDEKCEKKESIPSSNQNNKKRHHDQELKQNLGSLFKDIDIKKK